MYNNTNYVYQILCIKVRQTLSFIFFLVVSGIYLILPYDLFFHWDAFWTSPTILSPRHSLWNVIIILLPDVFGTEDHSSGVERTSPSLTSEWTGPHFIEGPRSVKRTGTTESADWCLDGNQPVDDGKMGETAQVEMPDVKTNIDPTLMVEKIKLVILNLCVWEMCFRCVIREASANHALLLLFILKQACTANLKGF